MEEKRIFKSKVLLKITDMVKEVDNDGKEIVRAVNEHYETIKGKELWESYLSNKAAHPIEEVMKKPDKIQFGVIYVLYGGKRAWIYNLMDNNS